MNQSISMSDPAGILLVIGVALLFLSIRLVPYWLAGRAKLITALDLQVQLRSVTPPLLLDVRTLSECAATGVIANTYCVPLANLRAQLATDATLEAQQQQPIVMICQTGVRAALAARLLQKAGFTQVLVLQGGISEWQAEGLQLVLFKSNSNSSDLI